MWTNPAVVVEASPKNPAAPPPRSLDTVKDIGHIPDEEIPEEFRIHAATIRSVKANPPLDLAIETFAFGVGFFTVTLMSPTLGEMKKLPVWYKNIIAAGPIVSGSLIRMFGGKATDRYGGRVAVLIMLVFGFLGSAALSGVLGKVGTPRLQKAVNGDWEPLVIFFLGIPAGAGVASFPCCMAMGAFSGKRGEAAFRQGVVGGTGNTSPSIPVFFYAAVYSVMSLAENYYLWTAVAVTGTILVYFFLHNSIYHQLKAAGIEKESAVKIAKWMGQEQLPPLEDTSLAHDMLLRSFNGTQKYVVVVMVIVYCVSFGGFLAYSATSSTIITARTTWGKQPALAVAGFFVLIGALTRTSCGFLPFISTSFVFDVLAGLTSIFCGGMLLALSGPKVGGIIPGMLLITLGMGVCNYGTFGVLARKLAFTKKMGIVAGIVGGLGACYGPVLTFTMAALQACCTKFQDAWSPSYEHFLLPGSALVAWLATFFFLPKDEDVTDRPHDHEPQH